VGLGVVIVPVEAKALPSETPDNTWHVNGPVWALARYGNTIFLGGKFTRLRERPVGVAGGRVRTVRNLAAINANTGGPAKVKVPRFAGTGSIVYALTVADGKLWIGGRFTSAGGERRHNIASINAESGSLRSFSPRVNRIVWALADDGTKVYAGGMFDRVNGKVRKRLAAFSVDGRLNPNWTPSANDKVQDIAVTPDKTRLFITGVFSSVSDPDGSSHARNAIARLGTATGNIHAWVPGGGPYADHVIGIGVNTVGARVYWAVGGPDWVAAFNIDSGRRIFKTDTDGTVGDAVVMGERLIIGGHFLLVAPQPGPGSCATNPARCVRHARIAALDLNGRLVKSWNPELTGHWQGAHRLRVYGNKLWIAGEFTEITGVKQNYFGRLS
jgi:hypothetical protein